MSEGKKLTLRDALRMAEDDPKFARALVEDPAKYKTVFGLNEGHLAALREVDPSDFSALQSLAQSVDGRSIADTQATTEEFLATSSELLGKDQLRAMMQERDDGLVDDIVIYGDSDEKDIEQRLVEESS